MLKNILLAFIPLFVTVDAIGTLPIFIALTKDLRPLERKRIIIQSIFTAWCLAFGFVFLGKAVFRLLGITMADFMIAGGVILFCIAMVHLIRTDKPRPLPMEELGAVPLGTPLIVGPAVLTTSMMMVDQYGLGATLISVILNISLAGFLFWQSDSLMKILGKAWASALSRVMALLLAAIAVMMIRQGVFLIINT